MKIMVPAVHQLVYVGAASKEIQLFHRGKKKREGKAGTFKKNDDFTIEKQREIHVCVLCDNRSFFNI